MSTLGWAQSWRIARRDLASGFRGLRLLFICLFLGVATLAAIGSLTSAITGEIQDRGQTILGGDLQIEMTQRELGPGERAELETLGQFSETIRLRAMAQKIGGTDGPPAVLTELKGVDNAYPLYGKLTLRDGQYAPLPADRIIIGEALATRLDVRTGDQIRYGSANFTIAGIIAEEPDRVGEGFTLGPVAIVSMEGLRRSELIQPGSLFDAKYRIRLPAGSDFQAVREDLEARYDGQGWDIDDRNNAAPGTDRFINRMGQFLSLIGLTALIIAGIGVSNGVSSYLALRRKTIATLKIVGATSADIARIYLLQMGAVSAAAIAIGLVFGMMLPPVIVAVAGNVLPVAPGFRLHPLPLFIAAIYGAFVAVIFTLPPLARAKVEPAAALLRTDVSTRRARLDKRTWAIIGAATVGLLAIILASAEEPLFSASVIGATALVLALLWALGVAVKWAARKAGRPASPLLRMAVTNLYRPGAQTSALVVALGLSLTLFVTLAGIQTSLSSEIDKSVPKVAPNLFILDVPSGQDAALTDLIANRDAKAELNIVPALRGTVVAIKGDRVTPEIARESDAFLLRGERGVTYSPVLPEGSDLTEGQWWAADYAGPPLVSLDAEQAKLLDLNVGDTLTVSVLGREIEARIASLRVINWDTMGFNYVMVFSPNSFASAPHSLTATVTLPDGPTTEAQEVAITRDILAKYPAASVIAVDEVVGQVRTLLDQMAGAILAAASITILAGIAVLIGAIAASAQSRAYDSIMLKVLGGTRRQILTVQALEYAMLAAALAAIALALGLFAAWFVIVQIFEFGWSPDWMTIAVILAGGAGLTLIIGLLGSLPLMAIPPAKALRGL